MLFDLKVHFLNDVGFLKNVTYTPPAICLITKLNFYLNYCIIKLTDVGSQL